MKFEEYEDDDRGFWLETEDWSVQFLPNKPITEVRVFRTKWKCSIVGGDLEATLTAYGLARMKHGDRYDERIGCRKAFESALRNDKEFNDDPMPKEDRAAIWDLLRARYPEPEPEPETTMKVELKPTTWNWDRWVEMDRSGRLVQIENFLVYISDNK